MKKHKEFVIPFSGLKQGKHEFDFEIDNTFFESFEYNEFNGAAINLLVLLNKSSTMLELEMTANGTVNISQYVYEMIVLAVPLKKVHPGVEDGTLKSATLEKLEKLHPKEVKENKNKETDPRWDSLKKLLTDK